MYAWMSSLEQQIKELRERVEKWEQSSIEHSKRIINSMIRLDEQERKLQCLAPHLTILDGCVEVEVKNTDDILARLDKLEYWKGHVCDNIERARPEPPEPAPPPERPEPKFKVGDWVRFLTTEDPWQIADIKDSLAMDEQRGRWRPIDMLQPAAPPECLCDARKREEEAGMILVHTSGDVVRVRCGQVLLDGESRWHGQIGIPSGCIHCKGEIKRSLLEEE